MSSKVRFYPQEKIAPTKAPWKLLSDGSYDPASLCDYVHKVYKSIGDNFPNVIFFTGNSLGFPHAFDYVKALTIEQHNLHETINETSFFNFFKKRKLNARYENGI